jgi:hypothetical protein
MPTYLETLAETHRAEAEADLLRLKAAESRREFARRQAENAELFREHYDWESADPFHPGQAIDAGLGSAANDLFHPGAIGRHNARPGSRRDGAQPPYFFTEMQHWLIVDAARTLEGFCPTAVNILDVLEQFAIFTGFTYKIVPKKKPGDTPPQTPETADGDDPEPAQPESNPTVDAAQTWLDEWLKEVDWHGWEKEIFRRSRRDGEAFLILEDDDDTGSLGLRAVEPEQIRDPINQTSSLNSQIGISGRDASWKFGILTTKRDTSKPIKYNVVSQYNDTQQQHEVFDAEEVFHLKINVERATKRGVSDFFAGMNDFPRVRKLLRNLSESASVQACVAWVEELAEGVMPTPLGGDAVTSRTGRNVTARTFDGPETLRVQQGHKYTAGPLAGTGQSETLIEVLQAALRNIGSRWQFPEGLVSGDASNANLASALVAEAPFVRAMECRQWFYRCQFVSLIERVLEWAAVNGQLPEGENLLDQVEVSVEMPPVVPRKAKEETERNAVLNERGILSNQTWSAREDLDFDDEQQNIAESPIEPPSIMLGMEQQGEADDDTSQEGSPEPEGERV